MVWQTPKTDWTAHDYYNASDLNRVESNTQYIADYLNRILYPVTLEEMVTDRTPSSIEFASSLNRVERNLDALTEAFIVPPGYQASKKWAALGVFDYGDATRLERNLQLIYDWLGAVVESFRMCGTFACGEGGEIY